MNRIVHPRRLWLFCLCFLLAPWAKAWPSQTLQVPIPGKQSILRVGALPDQTTDKGRQIAQQIMDGLGGLDKPKLEQARDELATLMDKENLGGGYSAMHWMLGLLLTANEAEKASYVRNPLDQAFVDFFFSDDFRLFKEYLQRKYGVNDFIPKDPEYHMPRSQFLEDMIIFNNPARGSWDSVAGIMQVLQDLRPAIKRVVDVGAGFGFYSYRLAQMVGQDGKVYAVDTSEAYVNQLKELVKRYTLGEIVPTLSTDDDVSVSEKVDLVFISSLYHVLYSWSQHTKRDPFLKSVREALRDDGYLVILDNNFHSGLELHDSYIEKDYIVAQLYFYGFELAHYKRLSETRYVLVFRKATPAESEPPAFPQQPGGKTISVSDPRSVVHVGSLDSFDITPAGIDAAKHLYQALDGGDLDAARMAVTAYDRLIPTENFGGEYSALRWVATYLLAPDESRTQMTQDPLVADYLAYLSENQFERLKFYVSRKYKLGKDKITVEEAVDEETRKIGLVQRQSLEDFILFNNPERETWEKSSLILESMAIKAGDTIVDVGSGAGYFTFKFAKLVGETGKVYALDTKKPHVDYISDLANKWGSTNVVPVLSSRDDLNLDMQGSADVVFMCSLYHILYAVSSESEREGVLKGIAKVLKTGGKFVVVDNGPVEEEQLPYHGPYIRKELIEAQLSEYGFALEQSIQIIPQRYMLVFGRSK